MAPPLRRRSGQAIAADVARLGQEVELARLNLGLSIRGLATLADASPASVQRLIAGDPAMQLSTAARIVTHAGLRLYIRAYPRGRASLRDTGQLAAAEFLRRSSAPAWRVVFELPVGSDRSVDVAFFGRDEVILVEIERLLADWQAQARRAEAKRSAVAPNEARPVRLVIAVLDTAANRRRVGEHANVIRHSFPASSRAVMGALRTGHLLGRDGLLWLRDRHRQPDQTAE